MKQRVSTFFFYYDQQFVSTRVVDLDPGVFLGSVFFLQRSDADLKRKGGQDQKTSPDPFKFGPDPDTWVKPIRIHNPGFNNTY